jgi:hypothetical protein
MGMRKDFILSEEEKQRRRERLEQNRHLTIEYKSSLTMEYFSESFNEIDRVTNKIEKIHSFKKSNLFFV